eukprot:TRINITY_DN3559_c1_g2_i1.p1 TRINITY_DN3559_c1_g2~~TRINITY_DN3559_c1_g2_i1.p1  ORF type:complete len:213 (-),score=29.55 TRINITY_DN3559_c1_g2_i1:200-838(-)
MADSLFTAAEHGAGGEAGEDTTLTPDNAVTSSTTPLAHLTRDTDILAARHHKTGYRDGAVRGQEETQQHGFNAGFALGMAEGWEWGRVYGRASALFIQAQQGRQDRDTVPSSLTEDKSTLPVLQELCDDIHEQARARRDGRTSEWSALVAQGWEDPSPDDHSSAPRIDQEVWTQAALTDTPASLLSLQQRSTAVMPSALIDSREGDTSSSPQ